MMLTILKLDVNTTKFKKKKKMLTVHSQFHTFKALILKEKKNQ